MNERDELMSDYFEGQVFDGAYELARAIEDFRDNPWAALCDDPERAGGNCENVSTAFWKHLRERGIKAQLVGVLDFIEPHIAVLVAGQVVDWSIRQFVYDADHPDILPEKFSPDLRPVPPNPEVLALVEGGGPDG
jgi:hypothetical protein